MEGDRDCSLALHLLEQDNQLVIVRDQHFVDQGKQTVMYTGGRLYSGWLVDLGYFGDFIDQYKAILGLRSLPPENVTGPVAMMLRPSVAIQGEFADCTSAWPCNVNASQQRAVEGLQHAVEKIQGPPGTGKSTTICTILESRIPKGEMVLITCSRNVAVESIVSKLERNPEWPLCVIGSSDRVGKSTKRHLLSRSVGHCFDRLRISGTADDVSKLSLTAADAIDAREAQVKGCRYESVLMGFLRKRYAMLYALRMFCQEFSRYDDVAKGSHDWCSTRAEINKLRAVGRAKVILCTISSSSTLLRECGSLLEEDMRIHTVIVDEAGCATEAEIALLFRFRPKNLILVGDHKQLPPVTEVPLRLHSET